MQEKSKNYHHGNLKNELIEKGIALIDKIGVENLSMRALAKECGVSSAAPYAHFKNKDEYIEAARDYVTEVFMEELQNSVKRCKDEKRILIEMGKAYVIFFYNNPLYYNFLFRKGSVDIDSYAPYMFYSEICESVLSKISIHKSDIENKKIAMWSLVHGLSGMAIMNGVIKKKNMEKQVEDIICAVAI